MSSGAPAASGLDLRMMGRALEIAAEAGAAGEVPVGAIVYRTATGEILGEGGNSREVARDPAGHAEFTAMLRASKSIGDWRLTGCSLAVTLEPCPMCAGLIVNARVDRVIYGAADPKAGALRTLYRLADDERLNHRAQVVPGVMAEECGRLLRGFFAGLRGKAPGA